MSQGPIYQINHHNTHFFIFNSGDSNQKIGSLQNSSVVHFNQSSSGAKLLSNGRSKPGNRSFLEFPFSEGEDETVNRIADDMSGRSLDLFTPSGSLHPSSKIVLEPSNRNKNSYDDSSLLEFESIRRVKTKSTSGKAQKPKVINEYDGSHTSEPFTFVPEPTLELNAQRSLPKITHLTSSTALALIQYKEASNQKKNELNAKKAQDMPLGQEPSPSRLDPSLNSKNEQNIKGSSALPAQQPKKEPRITKKTKPDLQTAPLRRGPSWFSRIFRSKPSPTAVGSSKLPINTQQLSLINDVSEQDAMLRRHGPRRATNADYAQKQKARLPRLVSFMIRLAGNPESKEGEVFSKILVT